jgi:hypothetical protein
MDGLWSVVLHFGPPVYVIWAYGLTTLNWAGWHTEARLGREMFRHSTKFVVLDRKKSIFSPGLLRFSFLNIKIEQITSLI